MKRRDVSVSVAVLLAMLMSTAGATESGPKRSPLEELPAHIRRLTHFGQRADFSHDGKRILFLERTFGDAFEVEVATGFITPVTHHFFHEGFTRALYLANGDILLSGARHFDANDPWPSRHEDHAELWVLDKSLTRPPVALGEHCSEGPAVSRRRMHIAWTRSGAFWSADIVYDDGRPRLANKKKLLDRRDLPFESGLETQNFRPLQENELIFSAYGYQGTEVCGLDLRMGKVTNYSQAPDQYDEPEGIFPDGRYTLVECNRHMARPEGIQEVDIYKLALDGSGTSERLTHFADYPGFKASNPVVSDDGRFMAFQVAKKGEPAGVGRGLLIFDLSAYESAKTN